MRIRGIAVVGGGSMGTALAINLSKKHKVTLVMRSAEQAVQVAAGRINTRYLPGVRIPDCVRICHLLESALQNADLILIATPAGAFAAVLSSVAAHHGNKLVIWGCKGFNPLNGEPLSHTAEAILGTDAVFGVLSGPSFAEGLSVNDPTALVVATNAGRETSLSVAESLSNATLRVYANEDLIGVQICGAIKNVYAIAAGIIDGCGWGVNTRAAMMTRAVAEAERYLGLHQSNPATLMGLSGFGDIYLTCGSRMSRNYQVGMALASGASLSSVLENLGHVAEGVNTTRLIHHRATELGVDMPIVAAVADILEGRKTPRECSAALMARDIGCESRPV